MDGTVVVLYSFFPDLNINFNSTLIQKYEVLKPRALWC